MSILYLQLSCDRVCPLGKPKMTIISQTISRLRSDGHRITRARQQLVEIFLSTAKPLSAADVCARVAFNKTTVYREVDFLLQQGIINEINFGEGHKRYESAFLKHHHHLVCKKCLSVSDVEVNCGIEEEMKKISERTGFQVLEHSLEFFGICLKCNT